MAALLSHLSFKLIVRRYLELLRQPAPSLQNNFHLSQQSSPCLVARTPCRYLDLLRQPGGVSRAVWDEMRQLSGAAAVGVVRACFNG